LKPAGFKLIIFYGAIMNSVFDPKTTALIQIDLQNGIVAYPLVPHSAKDVLQKSAALATQFRESGATVVYVRVDLNDMLELPTDRKLRDPNAPPPPKTASEIAPEAGMMAGDILITKRQWGAFYGTDLEDQLRKRNIKTVVVTGVATNYGVESTARAAAGLGFETIVVEDATTTLSAEAHQFAFTHIFPLLGRVRSTEQVTEMLSQVVNAIS
jgi:nicotinamidase-related amidase